MSGQRLTTGRRRLEELAVAGGEYLVVCAQTGTCPVPVAGKRFPDRETALEAARVAAAYREALRGYDARAPVYDLVVRREPTGAVDSRRQRRGVGSREGQVV